VDRHSDALKLKTVELVDEYRDRAWNYISVKAWFDKLNSLRELHSYHPRMVFQMDETSLQVKIRREAKSVCGKEVKHVWTLRIPPIQRCTALFIVQLNGLHVTPHLIFSQSHNIPISSLEATSAIIHESPSGWMDKVLFATILREHFLPALKAERRSLPEAASKRALLILDGHSSRLNRQLWEEFSKANVDVLVLPSHTSHRLQPLDCGVNAEFKRNIEKAKFPKRKADIKEFQTFLESIENAMYKAFYPPTIKASFAEANICAGDSMKMLDDLKGMVQPEPVKSSTRFSISGEIVTDELFQKKWELYAQSRPRKKIQRQVMHDDDGGEDSEEEDLVEIKEGMTEELFEQNVEEVRAIDIVSQENGEEEEEGYIAEECGDAEEKLEERKMEAVKGGTITGKDLECAESTLERNKAKFPLHESGKQDEDKNGLRKVKRKGRLLGERKKGKHFDTEFEWFDGDEEEEEGGGEGWDNEEYEGEGRKRRKVKEGKE
jgi:hypothetical protein